MSDPKRFSNQLNKQCVIIQNNAILRSERPSLVEVWVDGEEIATIDQTIAQCRSSLSAVCVTAFAEAFEIRIIPIVTS